MNTHLSKFFSYSLIGAIIVASFASGGSISALSVEEVLETENTSPLYWKYPTTVATSTIKFQLCTQNTIEGLPTDSDIPYEITLKNLRKNVATTVTHLVYAPLYKVNTCTPFTIHRDQLAMDGRGVQSVEITMDNTVVSPYFGTVDPTTAEIETTKDTDDLKANAVDFLIDKVIQKDDRLLFEVCNMGGKAANRTTFSFTASPVSISGALPSPSVLLENHVRGTVQSKLDSEVCKSVELLFDDISDAVIADAQDLGVVLSLTTDPVISEYNTVNNKYSFTLGEYTRDLTDYYAQPATEAGATEAGAGEAASMKRFANAANPFVPPEIATPAPETIVSRMFDNGLTKFADIDEFGYDRPVTRGEITKFFVQYAQLLNLERNENKTCSFTDIADYDQTLTPFITQACEYDLMKGFEGAFMPNDLLLGTEGITVLVRSLDGLLDESLQPRWQAYFDAAKAKNIIGDGYTPTTIEQPLSRGEIGLWLYRAHRYFEALEAYGPVVDESTQVIPDVSELENPEDIVAIIGDV